MTDQELLYQMMAYGGPAGAYLDPYMQSVMMNAFVAPELPMDIDDQRDYRNAYQDTITTGADLMSAYMSDAFAPGAFEPVMPEPELVDIPALDALRVRAQRNPDSFQGRVAELTLAGLDEGEILAYMQSVVDGTVEGMTPEEQAALVASMPGVQESPARVRAQRNSGAQLDRVVDFDKVREDITKIVEPAYADLAVIQAPNVFESEPGSGIFYRQAPAQQSPASEWLESRSLPNPYMEYGTPEYYDYSDPEGSARGRADADTFQQERQQMIQRGSDIAAGARDARAYESDMAEAMSRYSQDMRDYNAVAQQTPYNAADRWQYPVERRGWEATYQVPGVDPLAKLNTLAQGGISTPGGVTFTPVDTNPMPQAMKDRGPRPNVQDYQQEVWQRHPTFAAGSQTYEQSLQNSIKNRQDLQQHAMSQVGTQDDLLRQVMAEQQMARQGRKPGRDTVMARLAPLYAIGALGR